VQLATLVKEPPVGESWTYELKYDGYRILAIKAGTEVRLVSRRAQDWTEAFEPVARDVGALASASAVLDGEVCALDARGVPSFQLLQRRGAAATRLAYFVFDVLCDDGEDVRVHPLEERRRRLARMIGADSRASISLSKAITTDPAAALELACRAGYEGIVAKQKDSPYAGVRSKTWLKIKCTNRQEFAIIGWLPLVNSRTLVGSIILGLMEKDGKFHFAGKVGTGFDQASRKALFKQFARNPSKVATAVDVPRYGGLVRFVVPRLVAEVAFTEWTAGGHVRHPSFQGLRTDKKPQDCVKEIPETRRAL
jgi:bifunctional non-homologous end joining protein LigD